MAFGKIFWHLTKKKGRAYTAIAAAAAGGNRVCICIMVTLSSTKINLTHSLTHSLGMPPNLSGAQCPSDAGQKTQIEMLPRAL